MKQFQKIYDNAHFNSVLDRLIFNWTVREKHQSVENTVTTDEIHKCTWMASLLGQSENESHKQLAQDFASMLYLNFPGEEAIEKVVYLLYSRCGNLTASRFLRQIGEKLNGVFRFSHSFGDALDLELGFERLSKSLSGTDILLTDFQDNLWRNINQNDKLSISAPTSSGKSFIIQKFLQDAFRKSDHIRILYIVSSRALLSQVNEEFRSQLEEDVEIHSSFVFDETNPISNIRKHLLILTPERCLRMLQYGWTVPFDLSTVFVDEIQNVEETQGRGVLLEYVLGEIKNLWPAARKIIAGPMIKNPETAYQNLFDEKCELVSSKKSPVVQIRTVITPQDNAYSIDVLSKHNPRESNQVVLNVPFDPLGEFKKSIAFGLSKTVEYFGDKGQSIIYAPRTDYVQSWALNHALTTQNEISNNQIKELIDFLSDEIHPKYFLIRCLQKGIGFHHGKLPDIVRKELESLFVDGILKYLYCTSTLLEGVNLPANNLFIVLPKKRTDQLSPFEFGNLIGRAGRIKDSLIGTIYCIEKDENKWAHNYYESNLEKNIVSSTRRSLAKATDVIQESENTSNAIKNRAIGSSIVYLRHKYLKGHDEFNRYLEKNSEDRKLIADLTEKIKQSVSNVTIPYEILRLNPSVDPLLQQILYDLIKKEGVDHWIFHSNDNFYKRITKVKNQQLSRTTTSLFWQLFELLNKLDSIFSIYKEIYLRYGIKGLNTAGICSYATQWLENKSYRELIRSDINFYAKHFNVERRIDPENEITINERINEVIRIHSTINSFILVKYLKVVNDLLALFVPDVNDEKFRFSLNMPVMLELGTTKHNVILLISKGVNRSVALKVNAEFEKVSGHEEMDIVQWLKTVERLPLKPIYNRYLKNMKLLKEIK